TVRFDDAPGDVEAEAGAAMRAAAGQAAEGAEELVDVARWDADTRVMHTDMGFARRLPDPHGDGCLFVGILDGVIDQVPKCLLQTPIIPVAYYRHVVDFDRESVVGRDGPQLFHNFLHQCNHVARSAREGKLPGREARRVEQVIYQARQAPALADDDVGTAFNGFAALVRACHDLRVVDDGSER